jgi:hypothetical protein
MALGGGVDTVTDSRKNASYIWKESLKETRDPCWITNSGETGIIMKFIIRIRKWR